MSWYFQGGTTGSWTIDETSIKVKGKWKYIYIEPLIRKEERW
ncbi:DDE domain-containing protein, partial [Cytophagales bacterium RKSG123]|nr:DDE domain-containing protein [Xanthovirga aplysinae]